MKDKHLGRVIESIRRNRNFTVEELCEGIISASTYSRFVNGKTYLASDSFMKLVFRLHMTFAMFLQDYQNFFQLKHHYAILNHAKDSNDLALIQKLIVEYQTRKATAQTASLADQTWQIQDDRFLMVATALLSQLLESPSRQQELESVQEQMKQDKSLSDNDFFGLRLLLPYMALKDVEAVVNKPLKLLKDLNEPALAENLYYVCGLLYIKYLVAGYPKKAERYYQMLEAIQHDSLDLGWKLSRQLYQAIHLFATGEQEQAAEQLNRLSGFYADLNLHAKSQYIAQVCRELNIPHQEVEVIK